MSSTENTKEYDTSLWSTKAKQAAPYVPGEQSNLSTLLKLNTNENPFPPSKLVKDAIIKELQHGAENLRLYPDPDCKKLREVAAAYHGLTPQEIFVGNGSDDVLAHVFYSLFDTDKPVLTTKVTYGFYPVYAERFGMALKQVSLKPDFTIDTDLLKGDYTGIIIANPNAQTGRLLRLQDIEKILVNNSGKVVVIDEAYIDFSGIQEAHLLIENKLQPSDKAIQAAQEAKEKAKAKAEAEADEGESPEVKAAVDSAALVKSADEKDVVVSEGEGTVTNEDGDKVQISSSSVENEATGEKVKTVTATNEATGETTTITTSVDADGNTTAASSTTTTPPEDAKVIELKEMKLIEDRYKGASAIPLIRRYPNLVVVQTMSKSRSLAGLRIGFAFANENLIEALNRSKNTFNSYPVSRLAQVAAIASFEDDDYFKEQCRKVVQLRQELIEELEKLDFVVIPSQANFIMARHERIKTSQLYELLRTNYIMVRHFKQEEIENYIRITVGSKDQNKLLIQELRKIIKKKTGFFSRIAGFFKGLFSSK